MRIHDLIWYLVGLEALVPILVKAGVNDYPMNEKLQPLAKRYVVCEQSRSVCVLPTRVLHLVVARTLFLLCT